MSTEHRTRYEDNSHADYDQRHFNDAKLDPKQGNDWIIDAVQDLDQSPMFSAAAIISPTSGDNIMWENHWRRIAQKHGSAGRPFNYSAEFNGGEQRDGPLRAMCFTADLAYPHAEPLVHTELEFQHNMGNHTPANYTGPYEYTAKSAFQDASSSIPEPESKITQYQNMFPDDWPVIVPRLHIYCTDILQTGQNVTYTGIVEKDEQMMASGRAMMAAASDLLESTATNHISAQLILSLAKPELFNIPPRGDIEAQNNFAASRKDHTEFLSKVFTELTDEYPPASDVARFTTAETCISRDANSYHTRTMIALAGTQSSHGLQQHLASVNDAIFKDLDSSIVNDAQKSLYEATDTSIQPELINRFQHAYREMHLASEYIINFSQGLQDSQCYQANDARQAGRSAAQDFAYFRESGTPDSEIVAHIRQMQNSIPQTYDDGSAYTRITAMLRHQAHNSLEHAVNLLNEQPDDLDSLENQEQHEHNLLDRIRTAQTSIEATRDFNFGRIIAAGRSTAE